MQAAIAASVGVNQPKVMPPTINSGVSSAGSAAEESDEQRAPAKLLVATHAVAPRAVGGVAHHEQRHHRAGNEAAEKQCADRDVAHHAVYHERQGRRDDRPEGGGGGGDADGELGVVAVVLHRLDLDRAETRGVGDRRAGHAGEDDRAEDVHMCEPAAHPAAGRDRKIVDAVGDAGGVHQVAGKDEERHCQQRKAVEPAGHAVQDHEVGDAGDEVRVKQ